MSLVFADMILLYFYLVSLSRPLAISGQNVRLSIYNSNCYKIKLTRNDKIAQITSFYIAKMTKVWNNVPGMASRPENYTVNIDNDIVDLSIKQICTTEKLLDTAQVNFAQHLTYEETSFADARMEKLLPPSNYAELYSYIEKYYNSKML